jgi:acetate kinase
MNATEYAILVINGGSSSIKFALFTSHAPAELVFRGEVENIGTPHARLRSIYMLRQQIEEILLPAADFESAAKFLIDWIGKQKDMDRVQAIGHRIVHGMDHTEPQLITPGFLTELKKIAVFDPEHLPGEIRLLNMFQNRYPSLPQIACFDTAFHATMPLVAKWLAIPRKYFERGIRRYGFHGLSYAYLMEELASLKGPRVDHEKIILAHLGNGASLAAVKEGKSMDTSMGFTPTAGIPMGTRSGDLDPGVLRYLLQEENGGIEEYMHLITHQSGLLGISETNSDMRELLKLQATDHRAAEAIALFCYQIKKWIGSYAAALGGLDSLVFSGGIGENAPEIRQRVCLDLQFLGIELDEKRNAGNLGIISSDQSRVEVLVIKTNEELMIARMAAALMQQAVKH